MILGFILLVPGMLVYTHIQLSSGVLGVRTYQVRVIFLQYHSHPGTKIDLISHAVAHRRTLSSSHTILLLVPLHQ